MDCGKAVFGRPVNGGSIDCYIRGIHGWMERSVGELAQSADQMIEG